MIGLWNRLVFGTKLITDRERALLRAVRSDEELARWKHHHEDEVKQLQEKINALKDEVNRQAVHVTGVVVEVVSGAVGDVSVTVTNDLLEQRALDVLMSLDVDNEGSGVALQEPWRIDIPPKEAVSFNEEMRAPFGPNLTVSGTLTYGSVDGPFEYYVPEESASTIDGIVRMVRLDNRPKRADRLSARSGVIAGDGVSATVVKHDSPKPSEPRNEEPS